VYIFFSYAFCKVCLIPNIKCMVAMCILIPYTHNWCKTLSSLPQPLPVTPEMHQGILNLPETGALLPRARAVA
jgi:hypothetical protein